jgi:methionyl-tRNA formyltransferase
MIKIDFLICGKRAFDTLQYHVRNHGAVTVNQVVSYADKSVMNDPFAEVVSYCKNHGLAFVKPTEYKPTANIYRVVIGWQKMLAVDNNTIVFHDSLLPKYRGFSPLVNSLCNGESEIGVSAFFATENYDEGPVIVQKKCPVSYPITIYDAMDMITPLYFDVCDYVFDAISKNQFYTTSQNNNDATYSLWRDERDYQIDWSQSAEAICRFVDAVGYPYHGATSVCNGDKIIIQSVQQEEDVVIENRTPGKVIFVKEGKPVIVCGTGLLMIRVAHNEEHESIIPFNKFRSRFQ